MRLSIEHYETTSVLIFKKTRYGVAVRVDFTEEEKELIKRSDIDTVVIYKFNGQPPERKWLSFPQHIFLWEFLRGKTIRVSFIGVDEGKYYEGEVTDSFRQVKARIDANMPIIEKKKSTRHRDRCSSVCR